MNYKYIKVDVPKGRSGDWSIEKFTVNEDEANNHNMMSVFSFSGGQRYIIAGEYTKLVRNGTIVMSDTPAEIGDHIFFINEATGNVLINGLGLGLVIEALFQKKEVKSITVIEKSLDVINLVSEHYKNKCPKDKKLNVIHADALEYKPEKDKKYNAVWHDIWDYICGDNLEKMKTLHRKYGRKTNWQGSWCRSQCELSCRRKM